jgi:hypothetical protein
MVNRGPPTRNLTTAHRDGRADTAPQSPDKAISSKFGLCGRVVATITARAVSLGASGHVIVGEVMTPNARSQHGSFARMRGRYCDIRALKRAKLIMITALKRWAANQYSSANMTVSTRVVTYGSAGSGEP